MINNTFADGATTGVIYNISNAVYPGLRKLVFFDLDISGSFSKMSSLL